MTRRSTVEPAGRSSQFGEGTNRAPSASPSLPMRNGSALRIELFVDAQALHAIAQGPEGDAEELRRRSAVVAGLLQRVENGLALQRIELLGQRPAGDRGRSRCGHDARRGDLQVLGPDLA